MKLFKQELAGLKSKLDKQNKERKFLEKVLEKVLSKRFKDVKIPDLIRNFYVKDNSLFIEAIHKSAAQELFFLKEEIKNILEENNYSSVKKISIR